MPEIVEKPMPAVGGRLWAATARFRCFKAEFIAVTQRRQLPVLCWAGAAGIIVPYHLGMPGMHVSLLISRQERGFTDRSGTLDDRAITIWFLEHVGAERQRNPWISTYKMNKRYQ